MSEPYVSNSPLFRSLSAEEVTKFREHAEQNDPPAGEWDILHPVCREVWTRRGLGPKTLQQLANEALQVQDACNMAGVARSFGIAMGHLQRITHSSQVTATHAITRLWLFKMMELAAVYYESTEYSPAYSECCRIAAEGE